MDAANPSLPDEPEVAAAKTDQPEEAETDKSDDKKDEAETNEESVAAPAKTTDS